MEFPAVMLVDYVRVYQRSGQTNVGCDPSDYPTAAYINNHLDSYTSKSLSCMNDMNVLIAAIHRSQLNHVELQMAEEWTCT
jgi:Beta-glucan synthesis-associated protein SKN1/KRE6/Sbg1